MKLALYGLLISCCILLATADDEHPDKQRLPRSLTRGGFGGGRPPPSPTFPKGGMRYRRSLRGGFGGAPAPTPTFSSGPSFGGSRHGRSLRGGFGGAPAPTPTFSRGPSLGGSRHGRSLPVGIGGVRPIYSPTVPAGPVPYGSRHRRRVNPPFDVRPTPTFPRYPPPKL